MVVDPKEVVWEGENYRIIINKAGRRHCQSKETGRYVAMEKCEQARDDPTKGESFHGDSPIKREELKEAIHKACTREHVKMFNAFHWDGRRKECVIDVQERPKRNSSTAKGISLDILDDFSNLVAYVRDEVGMKKRTLSRREEGRLRRFLDRHPPELRAKVGFEEILESIQEKGSSHLKEALSGLLSK